MVDGIIQRSIQARGRKNTFLDQPHCYFCLLGHAAMTEASLASVSTTHCNRFSNTEKTKPELVLKP